MKTSRRQNGGRMLGLIYRSLRGRRHCLPAVHCCPSPRPHLRRRSRLGSSPASAARPRCRWTESRRVASGTPAGASARVSARGNRWIRPSAFRPAPSSPTDPHLQPGPSRLLGAAGGFSVAAVNILARTAALLLGRRHVEPGGALLEQQNHPVTLDDSIIALTPGEVPGQPYLSGAALS